MISSNNYKSLEDQANLFNMARFFVKNILLKKGLQCMDACYEMLPGELRDEFKTLNSEFKQLNQQNDIRKSNRDNRKQAAKNNLAKNV